MTQRDLHPELTGAQYRELLAKEREADREREEVAAKFKSRSNITNVQAVKSAEELRVKSLIDKTVADREREQLRKEAQIRLDDDEVIDLQDIEEKPTEEQFAKAERDGAGYEQVAEIGQTGSARSGITVYRRRDCPQAYKMMMSGVINREDFFVCCWYRTVFEATGLSGSIPSTDYGKEVFAPPQSRSMFADWQIDKQDEFRVIRLGVPRKHLALLDAVVLEDIPIHRATRKARAFHRKAKKAFEEAVDYLVSHKDRMEQER